MCTSFPFVREGTWPVSRGPKRMHVDHVNAQEVLSLSTPIGECKTFTLQQHHSNGRQDHRWITKD